MFLNLLKLLIGIGLIIGGGILEVLWLGSLFTSIVGVVLVLIFAPYLLAMPWTIGMIAGMAVIGSTDNNISIGNGNILESARSTLKGAWAGFVRVLVWLSWVVILLFLLLIVFWFFKNEGVSLRDTISQTNQVKNQPAITSQDEKNPSPTLPMVPSYNVTTQPTNDVAFVSNTAEATNTRSGQLGYYVNGTKVSLLNSPTPDGHILKELNQSDYVVVRHITEGWVEVESNGSLGWVQKEYLTSDLPPVSIVTNLNDAASVTKTKEVTNTRFGPLEVKNIDEYGKGLFYASKALFKREGGYLSIDKVYQVGNTDVALVSENEGGSGTFPVYFFVSLSKNANPVVSASFYGQKPEIQVVQNESQLTADLGYEEGFHRVMTFQNGTLVIQSTDERNTNSPADENDCKHLYDIYSGYVDNNKCQDDPSEVFGMVSIRSYNVLANDPRLNTEVFEIIAKNSCENKSKINYAGFQKEVCGK